MPMEEYPLEKSFMFVEPGPVLLITTRNGERNNIMTATWHMVLDFTPRIALATGPWNYSYRALTASGECVLAVPAVDLAEKAVAIGDCSGAEVDKFKQFGLTPLPAAEVEAPLIEECPACLECRVEEHLERQEIFILRGVRAWVNPARKEHRTFHARGDGTFVVDGRCIHLRSLMEDKLPPGV